MTNKDKLKTTINVEIYYYINNQMQARLYWKRNQIIFPFLFSSEQFSASCCSNKRITKQYKISPPHLTLCMSYHVQHCCQ